MNGKLITKLALTTAFVVIPTVGCTTAGMSASTKVSSASAAQKKAQAAAAKAEAAFAKGKVDNALGFAETAVEYDMQNGQYRDLLARVYMAQGRFASAERTLMDVMELGQVDPRTVVSLALSRIAQGKTESAISLVEANQSIIPSSDYGLTLALAGNSGQAIDVLEQSIRADGANARTRQNLALAYALDGRWQDARLMASQDMVQTDVSMRILEWAQYARPNAYETRIAGLLKVTPRADAGQPVRLALVSSPVQVAEAVPAVVEEAAPIAIASVEVAPSDAYPVTELAAVGPAPTAQDAPGFAAVEEETSVAVAGVAPAQLFEAPLISAPVEPVKSVAFAEASPVADDMTVPMKIVHATAEQVAAAYYAQTGKMPKTYASKAAPAVKVAAVKEAKPVKLALADNAPAGSKSSGTHVVQLGAFSSEAGAQQAWSKYSRKFGALNGATSSSSVATVNGKKLVRLAAAGFDSAAEANSVCRSIKANGGDCVVKPASNQPVRLASAYGKTYAR